MASVRLLYSAIMLILLDVALSSDFRPGRHQYPEEYEGYYEAPARRSRHRTRVSYGGDHPGGGGHPVGPRDVHVTHDVRHTVVKKRKRRRKIPHHHVPVVSPVVHAVAPGFQGSYAAVSGTPGRGSVHIVENVPSLGGETVHVVNGVRVASPGYTPGYIPAPVAQPTVVHAHGGSHGPNVVQVQAVQPVVHQVQPTVIQVQRPQVVQVQQRVPVQTILNSIPRRPLSFDRHPLPKCSYINTDFVGNDLDASADGDARGVISGSARACKALCKDEDDCFFWTYRAGRNRDCFLKEGTPGKPVPESAVPRVGYVSGSKDNNCPCIMSDTEEDEVCPIKNPRGLVYPWKGDDLDESIANGGGLGSLGGLGLSGIGGLAGLGGLGGLGGVNGLGLNGLGTLPLGWTRAGVEGDPAGIYTGGNRGTLDPRLTGILGNGLVGTGVGTGYGTGLLPLGTGVGTGLGTTRLGTDRVLGQGVIATGLLGTGVGTSVGLGNGVLNRVNTGVLGTNPIQAVSTGLALEDEVRILRDQLDILTRRLESN